MMTGAGAPDCARAARVLLRAACSGKLPLAIPPPDVDPVEFRRVSYPPLREIPAESNTVATKRREMTPKEKLALKVNFYTLILNSEYIFLIYSFYLFRVQ